MSAQTDNGRAFEWAVGVELHRLTKFQIQKNAFATNNQTAFDLAPTLKQNDLLNAANTAVKHILEKEKQFIGLNNIGEITFNSDAAGKQGDVRDILITINGKTIGISCKNNHKALKHPRLSGTINFIKVWGIDPEGCSSTYWDAVKPLFDELSKIKNDSNRTALWDDLNDKPNRFYWPVLDAWSEEINRVCAISQAKEQALCKTIISFIIGKYDFYKIIRQGKKRVIVQGFNLNNTLSTKKTKYPTCINVINKKNGTQYSKTIVFNHGYSINFRIHNAESLVTPSLKFDVKAIGLPADEIYQQTFDI
jgi:HaeIII restriction endonuclease